MKFTLHKEGYKFIAIGFTLSFVFSLLIPSIGGFGALLATCSFIFTALSTYFFRDPERIIPHDIPNGVVSPADGIVNSIENISIEDMIALNFKSEELDEEREFIVISIFLNVFNVHVNRMPLSAKVISSEHMPGKFHVASLSIARSENEKQRTALDSEFGKIYIEQIAGLIAKRVVCDAKKDQEYKKGDRFGIIRFGSCTTIYLPASRFTVSVKEMQTVVGGETIIAMAN